jgi:hypothetical protein
MMRLSTLFVLFFLALKVLAQMPVWHGQLLLHDGQSLMPNASIPTPAELEAVARSAGTASSEAQQAAWQAGQLREQTAALEQRVTGFDGGQVVYGTLLEFGSETIAASTNASAVVLGMAFPSNTVHSQYVELWYYCSEPLSGAPQPQVAGTASGSVWEEAAVLHSELSTFPVGGKDVEAYKILLEVPGSMDNAFFRVRGELRQQAVGKTSTFGEFSVNGVRGLSVTNAWGVFVDGLLVHELE